jgi:SAM-dependent methyltransferase
VAAGNWEGLMPDWDELFRQEGFRFEEPHESVVSFASELKRLGARRVLDLGFGAGRHVVYLAQQGFEVYGTDISARGMEHTRAWLEQEGLQAELTLSDMTVIPYPDTYFHGIISTYVIHHNTLANIQRCVAEMHRVLAPGGQAMVIVQCKRGHRYGRGQPLEPDTFVPDTGADAGIPHHFFDVQGLRELFRDFRVTHLTLYEYLQEMPYLHSHWVVTLERAW